MKKIELSASEIRSLEHFLCTNPCSSGCVYPEMANSNKGCNECKLSKNQYSIMKKLNLI